MTEVRNGHVKGRAVPALPKITFSSGYSVSVRRLPPMTQQRLAESIQRMDTVRGITRPAVPKVVTELGVEENTADPDYQAALVLWENAIKLEFNDRLLTLVCLDSVDVPVTDDIRQAIARKRRYLTKAGAWQDDPDLEPDENDRVLFMLHIAAARGEDLQLLYRAVVELSEPTPEVVEQHIETFPSVAPGA